MLGKALKELREQGYDEGEIGIGFVDEASRQMTTNTVRVWSDAAPIIIKNTERLKANAMGFSPLRAEATIYSGRDSREGFLFSF